MSRVRGDASEAASEHTAQPRVQIPQFALVIGRFSISAFVIILALLIGHAAMKQCLWKPANATVVSFQPNTEYFWTVPGLLVQYNSPDGKRMTVATSLADVGEMDNDPLAGKEIWERNRGQTFPILYNPWNYNDVAPAAYGKGHNLNFVGSDRKQFLLAFGFLGLAVLFMLPFSAKRARA